MKNRLHCFIYKGLFSLLLCCSLSPQTYSQHLIFGNDNFRVEAGLNFGPTFFLGDLGGHRGYGSTFIKDINLPMTKLMKGAFITAYPTSWLGIRAAAEYTYLEGNDALISTNGVNELYRKQRDLDFKTDIWEAYCAVEIYPLMLLNSGGDEEYEPKFTPYIFGGVGVFHFNPMGSLTENGITNWYYLRPLHTEGEGFAEYPNNKEYNLTQMNIPLGGGIKYFISDNTNLSIELLYRKTFTDYIDDVSTNYIDPSLFDKYLSPQDATLARLISDKTIGVLVPGASRFAPGDQRGDPKQNDAYFSFLLKLGIRLGNNASGYDRSALEKTRCPARF